MIAKIMLQKQKKQNKQNKQNVEMKSEKSENETQSYCIAIASNRHHDGAVLLLVQRRYSSYKSKSRYIIRS